MNNLGNTLGQLHKLGKPFRRKALKRERLPEPESEPEPRSEPSLIRRLLNRIRGVGQ